MTARVLTALCFSLALAGAGAQTTPPAAPPPTPAAGDAAKPSVRETPPDQKAYNEATKITDNEKKIAALEKLKTDFPSSMYASIADSQILDRKSTRLNSSH